MHEKGFCIGSRNCSVLEPILCRLSPTFEERAAYRRMKDRVKEDLNFGRKVVKSFQVCILFGKWSVSLYIAAER